MKVVRIFEQDGERWTKTDPFEDFAGWIATIEVDEWHGALRATVRGREARLDRPWSSRPLTVELVFPGEELPALEEGDLLEVPPSAPMTPEMRALSKELSRIYRMPTAEEYWEHMPIMREVWRRVAAARDRKPCPWCNVIHSLAERCAEVGV